MIGVALQQAPWLCVLEFLPYGDMRNFLQMAKEKHITLTDLEMVSWCKQLASGCAHISKQRVVHMDLAARNVLVGENNIVKIADFGMSTEFDPGQNTKVFKDPIRCAIKWTAMESMLENTFSEATDCWSLGIVFWEIATYAGSPYAHISNMDMLYYLIGGDRLMQPLNCHAGLWEVMEKCWMENPADRWKFADMEHELVHALSRSLAISLSLPLRWYLIYFSSFELIHFIW